MISSIFDYKRGFIFPFAKKYIEFSHRYGGFWSKCLINAVVSTGRCNTICYKSAP